MLKTTTKMKKKVSDSDLDSLKFFIYDNDEIEKDRTFCQRFVLLSK